MKDKKKLIVLIVMLLMPVAGIWYFIKMSLKYMKGAEIEIFFPNNFFKQFGVWSIIWKIEISIRWVSHISQWYKRTARR